MNIVREAAKKGAPPIDALRMACATLSLDLKNPNAITPEADFENAKLLVAKFPTIVAAHTRIQAGQEPIAPRADLSSPRTSSTWCSARSRIRSRPRPSTRTGSRSSITA
jgi:citrate synthase